MVKVRQAWCAAVQRFQSDWTTNSNNAPKQISSFKELTAYVYHVVHSGACGWTGWGQAWVQKVTLPEIPAHMWPQVIVLEWLFPGFGNQWNIPQSYWGNYIDLTVLGISQAWKLERVAISFLQGIFSTQGLNPHLLLGRQILYHWTTWEALNGHYMHIQQNFKAIKGMKGKGPSLLGSSSH